MLCGIEQRFSTEDEAADRFITWAAQDSFFQGQDSVWIHVISEWQRIRFLSATTKGRKSLAVEESDLKTQPISII